MDLESLKGVIQLFERKCAQGAKNEKNVRPRKALELELGGLALIICSKAFPCIKQKESVEHFVLSKSCNVFYKYWLKGTAHCALMFTKDRWCCVVVFILLMQLFQGFDRRNFEGNEVVKRNLLLNFIIRAGHAGVVNSW